MKYSILFMIGRRSELRMVVRYKMHRIFYNLGYNVDKEKWNKDTQRCKRNTTHGEKKIPATRINAAIQHYEDEVTRIAESYKTDPTIETFKSAISQALRKAEEALPQTDNFFTIYDQFIEEENVHSHWTRPMFIKMRTIKTHLIDYDPTLTFDKINLQWMDNYCTYLQSLNFRTSYTKKLIDTTKIFLKWAMSRGYLNDHTFLGYRCKLKEVRKRVIYLTWDELMTVYHHDFSGKEHLARVRDIFCFSCFTSLRYSDVKKLKKTDIVNGIIYVTTQKTSDSLEIELNDYSSTILARYADNDSDMALPVISNVKMNKYLKEMAKECDLTTPITETYYEGATRKDIVSPKWQLITTHCGRRTFICNALMMGIPPNIVMKWTGHSDYKSMQPYIDIADSAKRSAMSLFNKQ